MADFFTCKNCWNFHVRGKAEQGTCRARLKPVKTNRNDHCAYPKGFTTHRIVATYSIVNKRGGRIPAGGNPSPTIAKSETVMKTYTYTIHLTETERIVLLNCLNKCKDIARINKECTNAKKEVQHYQRDEDFICELWKKIYTSRPYII